MAKLTPAEFANKWATRLGAATEDIQRGVNRVTDAPTEKAAQKADKYLAKVTAAVSSGKFARNLRKVSLEQWKTATISKGIPRVSQGAQAAKTKVQGFAEQLNAHQDDLKGKINAMPDVTLEDSINRATAWIRGMATFQMK